LSEKVFNTFPSPRFGVKSVIREGNKMTEGKRRKAGKNVVVQTLMSRNSSRASFLGLGD
jgi:hypothetical protein